MSYRKVVNDIVEGSECIIEYYSKIVEDVTDTDDIDEAMKRLAAAKRALGLVNKLPDSKSRTVNRSRIMGNLNKIRALITRILKSIEQEREQEQVEQV